MSCRSCLLPFCRQNSWFTDIYCTKSSSAPAYKHRQLRGRKNNCEKTLKIPGKIADVFRLHYENSDKFMQTPLSVEELVIDDSFINYCYQRNQSDMRCWEEYLLIFPDQKDNVEDARNIVLGISDMFQRPCGQAALAELKKTVDSKYGIDKQPEVSQQPVLPLNNRFYFRKYLGYTAAAIAIGAGLFLFPGSNKMNKQPETVQVTAREMKELVYSTDYGEKKTIWLPDSTKVMLNARSVLRTDKNFGATERKVYLSGEALFDVTHQEKKPFTVHMTHFDVKVLGTLFNVKAYAEDKIQETSLIRGKVEIVLQDKANNTVFLKPNEKAIISNSEETVTMESQKNKRTPEGNVQLPVVTALTINSRDSSIVETSWVYNRLDIYNKPFFEIKTDLERLFKVNIDFKDHTVSLYRFSATFEKETIEQILKALQLSYPFHYTIENNNITISK